MNQQWWYGFWMAFAVIGGTVFVMLLAWLIALFAPNLTWWTIKKLPLASPDSRDRAAAVVGGARRAYCLRIPYGVRIIVALGGTRDEHEDYAALIDDARQLQLDRERALGRHDHLLNRMNGDRPC